MAVESSDGPVAHYVWSFGLVVCAPVKPMSSSVMDLLDGRHSNLPYPQVYDESNPLRVWPKPRDGATVTYPPGFLDKFTMKANLSDAISQARINFPDVFGAK